MANSSDLVGFALTVTIRYKKEFPSRAISLTPGYSVDESSTNMLLSPLPHEAFVTGHCLASSNQRGANRDGCYLEHEIRATDADRFESSISQKLFGG